MNEWISKEATIQAIVDSSWFSTREEIEGVANQHASTTVGRVAEALFKAIEAVEALEGEQKWIPVPVDLPASYTNILIAYRGKYDEPGKKLSVCKGWSWRDGDEIDWCAEDFRIGDEYYEVTHWMPFPEPPEIPELDEKREEG